MSVLFGVLGRHGQPVDREDLCRMHQAHAHLPADTSHLWQDGEIGFGLIRQYHTPESPHELFPDQSRCGRTTIVSRARLDNRDELLRLFEVPRELRPVTPDTTLLTMAYECWGESCIERLGGDWSCAVWNHDRRRLLLAMSPTGNGALFHTGEGPCFAFSTTPQGLLILPWVSDEPDLRAVGLLLSGGADVAAGSGFYRNMHALPPAHFLTIEQDRIETGCYWRPQRRTPLRLKDDGEYQEAFLEQYQRAVACRLRTYRGIGATLSGGLDSGSVVALAARALHAEGRSLPTFSAVPRFGLDGCLPAGRCGNETPNILATAHKAGNVTVNFLQSMAHTPTGSIAALTGANGAPVIGAVNCFWMHDLLEQAHQRGLRVLLTGQAGNGTVSWGGSSYCWDYFEGPSTAHALGTMVRWLIGSGKAGKMLLRGVLPTGVLKGLAVLRGNSLPSRGFLTHTPLRREFLASLHLETHFDRLDALVLRGSCGMRTGLIEATIGSAGRFWYLTGVAHGVEVRDPTTDKELIEFLFSIPEDQYLRNNEKRRLIRHAMKHLLPHEVCNPAERGLQGADIIYRIRENAEEIFETLATLEQHDLARETLDLGAMRRLVVRALNEASPELTQLCGTVVCRGLSVGLFLTNGRRGELALH